MRFRLLPLGASLLIGGLHTFAVGQAAPPSAAPVGVAPSLPRVEITGAADTVDFSDSAAPRVVVPRAELSKYGDSRLADALQRVPGVNVEMSSGRPLIRLRSLGEGYTQILVNGEPTRPDFSIDSIPISTVERVEVLRVGTVDMRTAGIAGTINIVLRQTPRTLRREVKANVSSQQGRTSGVLDGFYGDTTGQLSYSLGAVLVRIVNEQPAVYEQSFTTAQGEQQLSRHIDRFELNQNESLTLMPNLTWRPREGESVRMENLFRLQRYKGLATDVRTTQLGSRPDLDSDTLEAENGATVLSTRLSWTRPLSSGSNVDVKLSASRVRREADSVLHGFREPSRQVLERLVSSLATDDSVLLSVAYRIPYTAGHAVSLGWDAEYTQRNEDRIQRETTSPDRTPQNLDEDYTARIRRVALFVQDEWEVSSATSLYLGVRWEGLQTRSTGNVVQPVTVRSSVVSPVLQALWNVPSSKDRVRLALGRTYKAPTTMELIARRWVVPDNTPASPNFQGNASLKPELAWGIDLSYEHQMAAAGSLTATVFSKRIENVILRDISFIDGVWVQQPANRATAKVHGVEFDAKINLSKLWEAAPAVDVKFNATGAWSRVEQVPGPDNRLDRQKPYSGNIGVDYRLASPAITVGANLGIVGGGWSRSSSTVSAYAPQERRADAYAVWKATPTTQIRLALARRSRGGSGVAEDRYVDDQGAFRQSTREPGVTTVRVGLELSL